MEVGLVAPRCLYASSFFLGKRFECERSERTCAARCWTVCSAPIRPANALRASFAQAGRNETEWTLRIQNVEHAVSGSAPLLHGRVPLAGGSRLPRGHVNRFDDISGCVDIACIGAHKA